MEFTVVLLLLIILLLLLLFLLLMVVVLLLLLLILVVVMLIELLFCGSCENVGRPPRVEQYFALVLAPSTSVVIDGYHYGFRLGEQWYW
jgi:hypothetical protein